MLSRTIVLADNSRLLTEFCERAYENKFFFYDTETVPSEPGADDRGVPARNRIMWLGMATDGAIVKVPMGHPIGTDIIGMGYEPRLCTDGKTRNYKVPVYSPPPPQMSVGEVFDIVNPLFADPDVWQSAHGQTFDDATVAKYRPSDTGKPQVPKGNSACTIEMHHLTDENVMRYGLKYVTKANYGFVYDDAAVGRTVEKFRLNVVAQYLHYDLFHGFMEYKRLRPIIEAAGLSDLWQMEMDLTEVLADMRTTGVRMDEARLEELRGSLSVLVGEREREFYHVAGRQVNLNSPAQLQKLLYLPKEEGGRGIPAWKMTDGGRKKVEEARKAGRKVTPDYSFYSTDDESLDSFTDDPVVSALMEYRVTNKVYGTYVLGYLGDPDDKEKPNRVFNGIVYPDFVQYGAATGRFSCRDPNLQNVPRPTGKEDDLGTMIRGLFIADPGCKLIVADYGQIELVLLAHFIGHGALWDGFLRGIDPHTMTAAMALNLDPEDMQREVNAGDKKAKDSRQRYGKSINFACVPMNSQALTKNGWKSYDDINEGDLVLANDGVNAVWTPVLEKVKYDSAPVIRMGNSTWESFSTPNHRWVTDRRTGHGSTRRYVQEFSTTENLNTEHRIILSSPLLSESSSVSPVDAAIIAWLHTDGHMKRAELTRKTAQGVDGHRRGFQASIFQDQKKFVAEIDALLTDVPHHRYTRPSGIVQWLLDPQFARDLWSRADLDNLTLEEFVLSLGTEALNAFANATWQAEGWTDARGVRLACQNEGPVLDAMQTAYYLQGYDVTRSVRVGYTGNKNWILRMRKPRVTMQRMSRDTLPEEAVWCIRTVHENWVMRQNDRIMLTGNTVYGAWVKKLASMMSVSVDEAQEFKDVYDQNTPEIGEYRQQMLREARRHSLRKTGLPPHTKTILGRVRRVPELMSGDRKVRNRAERQAFNSHIQGSSADLTKLAMVRFYKIKKASWKIVLSVHDELVIQAPIAEVEEARAALVWAMTGDGIQDLVRLPLKIDVHVVDRWSQSKL